jgi:hypothetical protein
LAKRGSAGLSVFAFLQKGLPMDEGSKSAGVLGRFALPETCWLACLVVPGLVLLAGCDGSESGTVIEKVVPAEGTLTYQGRPLAGYQVTLLPTDGRRPAVGISDAQGHFRLGTNTEGDGAPPGKHPAAIVWIPPRPSGEPGQEVIVDNPAQLPKPKVKIPDKYGDPKTSGLEIEIPPRGTKELKIDLQ